MEKRAYILLRVLRRVLHARRASCAFRVPRSASLAGISRDYGTALLLFRKSSNVSLLLPELSGCAASLVR
ncbi:hypothetical protein WS62_00830 [Burkholderia sp. ABCPW 14]|nr:hypothetical protein WS62_00830 [Burkholderia sp. ABCPW 14]